MTSCCLCKKKMQRENGTFFGVPKDERRKRWSEICRLQFAKNARICEDHFLPTDIIRSSKQFLLLPNAVPFVQTKQTQTAKKRVFCALGCPSDKQLYKFPSRINDVERRMLWLNFFDMEDPNIEDIFACERHFSHMQSTEKGIRLDAVPDVPTLYNTIIESFSKNPNKLIKKASVTTSGTQEDIIYSKKNGIFTQNVYNINNNVQSALFQGNPVLEIPLIKTDSRTASTQTNTRLCGTIQVSEFADQYRINCFYCCKTFSMEKWKIFRNHLNKKHFAKEEAFKISKYASIDHDYTPIRLPSSSPIEVDPLIHTPSPETVVINANSLLPYVVKPVESTYGPPEADVSNPNFYYTPEDTIIISDEPENFNNFVNSESYLFKVPTSLNNVKNGPKPSSSTHSSKNEKNKPIKKRTIRKSSKNVIGNTGKKIISSGVLYIKNTKRQTSNKTALSRCLKRSDTIETIEPVEVMDEGEPNTTKNFQQETTELSFEYTPHDIIDFLLESMKNYPVLWEFDNEPFNEDYYEAIEELCKLINVKWSLNIDTLKMRRSVNRILKFYCSVYPCENVENVNQFANFYDKCAAFLPKSVYDIAYARCSHCYRCFKNESELKAHLLEEYKYLQWPHKCVQCKECFRESDEFEFHKLLPHFEEVFRCELCNKSFVHRNKFNKHVSRHQIKQSDEPGKYVCNICGKVFKISGELRGHLIYHGEKKHKCHLCPKSYYTNATLRRHIMSHNKEYELMCEVCGKGFIHHTNLREHMTKHTGAKVTCNICNLQLRKSSLMRHLRTVHVACEGTIETTFRAKNHHYKRLLLRPNRRRSYRKRYKKEKNYICKICNIRFDGYKFLVEHNKEFHADAPKWPCKICNTVFRHKINIRRHYREKHNLHVYQAFKLVDQNEDLETVLAIQPEELEKLCETLAYSLNGPSSAKTPIHTTMVKSDPSAEEIYIDEERLHSDTIQDEIMQVADHDSTSTHEIKVDDDHYMNDFFTNLLK
ncbi:uncharacterized protein LOC135961636 [Calliphora vicina]|uniref:uncharacterized protein LOC135961636 n=1 Tax=Calliphora vicina TaxID=7373 RepID=UPI00325C2257